MASWSWDENDNGAIANETVWPFSSTTSQPSNPPSQWLFSSNSAAPVWPQPYETPLPNLAGALRSTPPQIDQSMNLFDGTFGDAAAWENWDAWDDLGNTGDDELDT